MIAYVLHRRAPAGSMDAIHGYRDAVHMAVAQHAARAKKGGTGDAELDAAASFLSGGG